MKLRLEVSDNKADFFYGITQTLFIRESKTANPLQS
jgi:hypothetical protein